ncbi:MAG: hypothetical protein QMD85_05100, partial [Candidatus Aenigmarchaeota archaeon]|nr:hypothetical protein [Candidatus Aenigmarchaeota archaeon]
DSNYTITPPQNQSQNITALDIRPVYPKNSSVLAEGNHTFVFYVYPNASCQIIFQNSSYENAQMYLPRGYYYWGISCSLMNQTYLSDKNYFVVMSEKNIVINYSDIRDIRNASNISVQKPYIGNMVFTEPIDLTLAQEIEKYINISRNRVEIDIGSMQHLNKSAIITLYNITAKSPLIKQDGKECPLDICRIISYENNTLVFSVKHFTVYEIEDSYVESTTPPPPQTQSGGGSLSSYSDGQTVIAKVIVKNVTKEPMNFSQNKSAELNTTRNVTQSISTNEKDAAGKSVEIPEAAESSNLTSNTYNKTENYITGSAILNIIASNFVYLGTLIVALIAALLIMKRKRN